MSSQLPPNLESQARAALRSVRDQVDAFFEERATELECQAGCDACCRVALSVSAVEAAPLRERIAKLEPEQRKHFAKRAAVDRCALLEDDGRCAIYDERPLVCRSQGLALAYPDGVLPIETVRARGGGLDVTWCPLNYETAAPSPGAVFHAERVDIALAKINRVHCEATGESPTDRYAIRALLEEEA